MQKTIITLLVLLLSISCQDKVKKVSDIRELTWGMTKDEVTENESCRLEKPFVQWYIGYFGFDLTDYDIDILECPKDFVGDYQCRVHFYFIDDKLFEIEYYFKTLQNFLDSGLTKSDFYKQETQIKQLLTKQFGESIDYKELKNDKYFSNDRMWLNRKTFVNMNLCNDPSTDFKEEKVSLNFVSKGFKDWFEKKSNKTF